MKKEAARSGQRGLGLALKASPRGTIQRLCLFFSVLQVTLWQPWGMCKRCIHGFWTAQNLRSAWSRSTDSDTKVFFPFLCFSFICVLLSLFWPKKKEKSRDNSPLNRRQTKTSHFSMPQQSQNRAKVFGWQPWMIKKIPPSFSGSSIPSCSYQVVWDKYNNNEDDEAVDRHRGLLRKRGQSWHYANGARKKGRKSDP